MDNVTTALTQALHMEMITTSAQGRSGGFLQLQRARNPERSLPLNTATKTPRSSPAKIRSPSGPTGCRNMMDSRPGSSCWFKGAATYREGSFILKKRLGGWAEVYQGANRSGTRFP